MAQWFHFWIMSRVWESKWVPRLLTTDLKPNLVTASKEYLALFSLNTDEFLCRFITVEETWIHHSNPKNKNSKVGLSAKVRVSVCWDVRGFIHFDCLQKGKTVNGEYFANVLTKNRNKGWSTKTSCIKRIELLSRS